jgi:hypothetical protein
MNRRLAKRVEQLDQRVRSLPLDDRQVDQHFQSFCECGELPSDQRVAAAVVDRALTTQTSPRKPVDFGALLHELKAAITADPADCRPDPRRQLFGEAVHAPEPVQQAARLVIKALVAAGGDVTDPDFVPSDLELPEFGSFGMHLIGWPTILVQAPHEEQAENLLARLDLVRRRISSREGADAWFEDFASALHDFHEGKGLPADDALIQEAVLVVGELAALTNALVDEPDATVLRAYREGAAGPKAARRKAIARLERYAREGRLSSA